MTNKRGSSYVSVCVVVLVIVMILSAVIFYASSMTIVQNSKKDTALALDSFVMQNSVAIYNSIKQGNDYTRKIDNKAFLSAYRSKLSLESSGEYLCSRNENGEIVYKLTAPVVSFAAENTLKLQVNYQLLIPVDFAGETLFWMTVPVEVHGSLTLIE